ncbi:MAG: carbohydrate kinase family protein [Armatimonadota bacterium]
MRSGIVCSGVSCLDLFLYGTEPLMTRESLSMVRETQYRPGGATSNTGRALVRLGMPVEYMTVLGADANGDILMKLWETDGIDTRYVIRTDEAGTALSTIPVYSDGKRGVYFCPGTNEIMGLDNLFGLNCEYLEVLKERLVFHLGYPPLMKRMQGQPLADLLAAVRETGVMVTLDTTPVADDTTLYQMLAPALPIAHMFTPNIEEASQVAGQFTRLAAKAAEVAKQTGEATDIENIITQDDLISIGEFLLGKGLPIVVITLGPNGAFICTGDESALRTVPLAPADLSGWANQRVFVPAYLVEGPVNTTGAGDTFTAGILTGICKGLNSLREIAQLAHCSGALHVDLSRGACTFEEVQAALPTMKVRLPKNPHLCAMIPAGV